MKTFLIYFYKKNEDEMHYEVKVKTGCEQQAIAIARKILESKNYFNFFITERIWVKWREIKLTRWVKK